MKKIAVGVLACLFVLTLAAAAGEAEKSASNVPKIIRIDKDQIKFGGYATYSNLVRQIRQTVSSNPNLTWVAATPVAGDTASITYVSFHNNFAEIEQSGKAWETATASLMKDASFNRSAAESISGSKAYIARLREDLSYRPERFELAHATTWEISVVKTKPGTEMTFSDIGKEMVELHKKANIDEHWVAYQVEYGSGEPTFIFLTALKAMSELDRDLKEAHKAVFTESIRRRFSEAARETITSEYTNLLSVRPELSRAPQTLVAANPTFWTVKEPAVVVARGKSAKTKSSVQPAAMKETEKK